MNKLKFIFLISIFRRIIAKLIIETINSNGIAASILFVMYPAVPTILL